MEQGPEQPGDKPGPIGRPFAVGVVARMPADIVSLVGRAMRLGPDLARSLEKVPGLIMSAEALLRQSQQTVERVSGVADGAQALVDRATAAMDQAEVIIARAAALSRTLGRLQPLLTGLADVGPGAPADAAEMVRKSMPLLNQVESTVMPLLDEIRAAVPDVRAILPLVQRLEPAMADVETRLAGLPGGKRLRERGERVISDLRDDAAAPGADD